MKILSVRYAPPLRADLLLSVAFQVGRVCFIAFAQSLILQILHRLPDELLYKIARHTCDDPDSPKSLPYSKMTFDMLLERASLSSEKNSARKQCRDDVVHVKMNASDKHKGKRRYKVRPPWKQLLLVRIMTKECIYRRAYRYFEAFFSAFACFFAALALSSCSFSFGWKT